MKHIRYLLILVVLALFATLFIGQNDSLSAAGKIEISSASELAKIGNDLDYPLDGDYLLTTDIDLKSYNNGDWEPIGDEDNPFTGTFDGNNHSLNDLRIIKPNDEHIGLFGQISEATIENLTLKNVNVKGETMVGALVGQAIGNNTNNVFLHNIQVDGKVTGGTMTGGVLGYGTRVEMSNIKAAVHIDGLGSIGGLVGRAWGSSILSSFSLGDVISNPKNSNSMNVGGLVGALTVASGSRIENSYATGKVEGKLGIGGLVGNLGTATNASPIYIDKTYATGEVIGEERTGGLVGIVSTSFTNPEDTIANSYYDKDTTGQNDTDKGEGKSTSDMLKETTYDDWDFAYTWGINLGEYPHLRALSDSGPKNPKDIISLEAIDPIEVELGTSFNDIALPQVFANLYNGGREAIFVQSWNEKAAPYDENVPGDYVYESTQLLLDDGVTNSQGLKAEVTITVLPPQEITSVEDLVDITVDFGTVYNDIGLPNQVEVELDNGNTQSLDVNWDQGDPNYDGETPHNYTFTGTLNLPNDIVNPHNLEATVKVTVTPNSEINIPLNTETDIYAGQKGTIDGSKDLLTMPTDLPNGVTVIITDVSNGQEVESATGIEIAGSVYHFEFKNLNRSTFSDDFTLTLTYNQDDATDIDIYYFNESDNKWEAQNGSVDTSAHTITISPSHFSIYGVFALEAIEDDADNGDPKNGKTSKEEKKKDEDEPSDKDVTINGDSEDEEKDTNDKTLPKTSTPYYTWFAVGLALIFLSSITWLFMKRRLN